MPVDNLMGVVMSLNSYNKRDYGVPHFIRDWRVHRGLTVDKLADLAGCSSSLISQLERGACHYSQATLERLADALNCRPWQLLAAAPGATKVVWQDLAANTCWRDVPAASHHLLNAALNRNCEAAIDIVKAAVAAPEQANAAE